MADKDDDNILGPGAGHNAGRSQLESFVERIERLEDDKRALAEDLKEVYAEAKGTGFDAKQLRRVIAYRKKDPAQVQEEEAIFEMYLHTLGMLDDE